MSVKEIIIDGCRIKLTRPIQASRALTYAKKARLILQSNAARDSQGQCAKMIGLTVPGLRLYISTLGIRWNNIRKYKPSHA